MTTEVSIRFEQKVKAFIAKNCLLCGKRPVLVALSGGADSVALLRVLLALGYACKAAHCNFHLRGEESDRDERFVRALCEQLQVPLFVHDFDVPAYMQAHGVSLEMACRDLRYAWFKALLREQDCQALAVAHHQNDNVETFFLNALRGTGINGLTGIQAKNGAVVRPLLCVSRMEVIEYLRDSGQDYVTDSSNQKNDVKRNRLRNVVLPAIEAQFPGAHEQLGKTISQVQSGAALYAEFIERAKDEICERHDEVLLVDYGKLLEFTNANTLLFEILKPYGFNYAQCSDVIRAIGGENSVGKQFYSSSFTLTLNRTHLEVFVNKVKLECSYGIDLCNKEISTPVKIQIQKVKPSEFGLKSCNGKDVIALSAHVLEAEKVVVRHWRNGDKFRPFGMKGSKLVSDLFTDLKLGQREKDEAWIMEADGRIIWVMGYRASALYKVSPDDDAYLVLRFLR
ncbi:MAG: tRNA lysidine(34) synthetase TilS [Bacteroidales bacterium]|nr:tRNA lysidine(34) synthetase TilS [Bacteroidales bacterium]